MARISQVTEVASRHARIRDHGDSVEQMVSALEKEWGDRPADENGNSSLALFIPIRLVSCIEAAVRIELSEMVDRGAPYVERGIELLKKSSVKDLWEIVAALDSQKITIGALVAHSRPLGSIDDVLASLIPVYGDTFKADLSIVHDRTKVEIEGSKVAPIIADLDQVLAKLARLFEVRHIIVHEAPTQFPSEVKEIDGYIAAARDFLGGLFWTVSTKLDGAYPLTQSGITEASQKRLEETATWLRAALESVRSLENEKELSRSQELWSAYVEHEGRYVAGYLGPGNPGTMAPMTYAEYIADRSLERISDLQEWWK